MIELEVVGVTARRRSDEERQRLTDQAQALAEQRGVGPSVVVGDVPTREPWVKLKEKAGDRVLEFSIGPAEAQAIALALHAIPQPRPMTHDLIGYLLRALGDVSVRRVTITKREGGTFYAALELRHRDEAITVDCRPSDGIALAVRLGVPVVAADELEPVLAAA